MNHELSWRRYLNTEQSPRIGALAAELLRGNSSAVEEFWAEVEQSGAPLIEAYNPEQRQCLVTFVWREPAVTDLPAEAGADPTPEISAADDTTLSVQAVDEAAPTDGSMLEAAVSSVVESAAPADEQDAAEDEGKGKGEDENEEREQQRRNNSPGRFPRRHLSVELELALDTPEDMDTFLQRLGDSDVWYRTLRLRSDLRVGYNFMIDRAGAHHRPRPGEAYPEFADPFNVDHHAQGTDLPGVWGGEEPMRRSTLVLPDAEPCPWLERRRAMPRGEVTQHTLRSEILDNSRQIWVSTPEGYNADTTKPYNLLVIFDGETALQPMGVPMVLDALQEAGEIGPTVAIMVGNANRSKELTCHQPFADFMASELLPWVQARYRVTSDPERTVISGLSYGGLAAMFVALRYPQHFGLVHSQSGSFWWKPFDGEYFGFDVWKAPITHQTGAQGWLTAEYMRQSTQPLRIWMETGIFEAEGSSILPVGLTGSNQHLRDVLLLKGYDLHYREYIGGHDYHWWRGTLGDGIRHLLGRTGSGTSATETMEAAATAPMP